MPNPAVSSDRPATAAFRYGYPGFLLSLATQEASLSYWDYQLRVDGGNPRNLDDYRPYTRGDYANPNEQMTLVTGMERTSIFANAGVDLRDDLTFTLDALYNHRDTMQQIAGYRRSLGRVLRRRQRRHVRGRLQVPALGV